MKKILAFILAFTACTSMAYANNEKKVSIEINGQELITDTDPVIVEGRTLVPLRAIAEGLECDVSWNDENRAITVFDGNEMCFLWIDKDAAFKTNGRSLTGYYIMDTVAQIVNDRTLVPVRCISEMFGAKVSWINDERKVVIEYEDRGYKAEEGFAKANEGFTLAMTEKYDAYHDYVTDKKDIVKAQIELENGGLIEFELYKGLAPLSVDNFVKLAEKGAYDGKIFHRVIKDFMIQTGAFDKNGEYTESENVVGEFNANGILNLIPHNRGVISMARAMNYNSGSNQFFIVHKDSPHLDGQYAAFGMVTKGMEYVDEIAQTKTDASDKPVEDEIIKTVKIIK